MAGAGFRAPGRAASSSCRALASACSQVRWCEGIRDLRWECPEPTWGSGIVAMRYRRGAGTSASGGCKRTVSFSLPFRRDAVPAKKLSVVQTLYKPNATQLKLLKTLSQNLVELVGLAAQVQEYSRDSSEIKLMFSVEISRFARSTASRRL